MLGGISPFREFEFSDKDSKFDSLPMVSGMFPVRALKLKSKVTSDDRFPIEIGISPVRFAFESTRVVRWLKEMNCVGKIMGRLIEEIVISETKPVVEHLM